MSDSTFLWFLHQPASAGWLKRELAQRRPDLRFAFARPGLTTWKVDASRADEPVTSSFARAWGRSLGRAANVADLVALTATLPKEPLRLHVAERDPDVATDERDPAVAGSRARALELALREAAPDRFMNGTEAQRGELVLDVIVAAAEHKDDGLFVGWHRHDRSRGPFPGGVTYVPIPEDSPSRAWAKIEESFRWSGVYPCEGEYVVELGSAPGGISFALLSRGLYVHGVDPGLMAPNVLNYVGRRGNKYTHHTLAAASLERQALPKRYQWIVSDMNLAPMVALKYLERYVALGKGELKGAFITLKINDDGIFAALPRLYERIAAFGAREVRYVQLPSHRNELVAILEW